MTRVRGLRLALIAALPTVCLVVGILVLRGGAVSSLADGPDLSAASAWPPIPSNLSGSPTRYSKVADIEASASGILVVWSEGANSPNGEVWMSWNDKSGWEKVRVDDLGGYIAFSPAVVLRGTTAHFVWVGKVATSEDYRILYRARNLATGTWLSAGQLVYPAVGNTPDELGSARIAVDAGGTPHVVWTRKYLVNAAAFPTSFRDRVFYSYWTGSAWSPAERISGYRLDISPDSVLVSQDMPALVASGSDVYVAWREKSAGDRHGIWVRHRLSNGQWVPGNVASGEQAMGYQIGHDKFDEFPAMAVAGPRLYVVWDQFLRPECDFLGSNCYQVYSMTYRVQTNTGAGITASWWPTVTQDPADLVMGDLSPISALSVVTTRNGVLDPDFQVPIPDDYYSGARPQIGVIEATGVFTPYVVWHHWANEGHQSSAVNGAVPYQVRFTYAYQGDLATARWEDPQAVDVLGAEGIFSAPAIVLAPDIDSPHHLHVGMNVRLADPAPWDVLYTNLGQYYGIHLPLVAKNH